MPSHIENPKQAVAAIFNSAVAASALSAAWELGFLDELRNRKTVDLEEFSSQHDLDKDSIKGLVTALEIADIVAKSGEDWSAIIPGRLLEEAYTNKSLFHWLTNGSAELFSKIPYVVKNKNRTGAFYQRDSVAIAYACHDINSLHFDAAFWTAMDGLDFSVNLVVDLGSGSGERLMQILDRYHAATGIGIDVAGPALKVAAADAASRGYNDRLSFMEGDARELSYREEFAEVDLLTCFLMGHDFWPRENCVASLKRLREAFPKARRFLMGDATRVLLNTAGSSYAVKVTNVPTFTLGFEFGHAMMGVYLPTMEDWEGVFAEGGWRCRKSHLLESPSRSVIFELEHT
ncbi:hypothetical protein PMIN04_007726 [Paraphaeosphaeria minitans]